MAIRLSKEELGKLAKYVELLAEIDQKNKRLKPSTSTNPNSRN